MSRAVQQPSVLEVGCCEGEILMVIDLCGQERETGTGRPQCYTFHCIFSIPSDSTVQLIKK